MPSSLVAVFFYFGDLPATHLGTTLLVPVSTLVHSKSTLSIGKDLPPRISVRSEVDSTSLSVYSKVLPQALESDFPSSLATTAHTSVSYPKCVLPCVSLFKVGTRCELSATAGTPESQFASWAIPIAVSSFLWKRSIYEE